MQGESSSSNQRKIVEKSVAEMQRLRINYTPAVALKPQTHLKFWKPDQIKAGISVIPARRGLSRGNVETGSEVVDGSLRPFATLSAATRTGVISKSASDNAELLRFVLGLFIIQRKGSGSIALTG